VVKLASIGLAAILVLGGGFYGYIMFMAADPAPAPPPVATKAPPPASPAAQPGPTPSGTLNAIAAAPINAVNKAKEAVAAGQARVDAGLDGGEPPATTGSPIADKVAATPKTVPTPTAVSPGLAATTELIAAPEATAAFRSFVANAKVSGAGVVQGTARAFINDRLTRGGEMVDIGLGIAFEGIDAEKRTLLFRDRSGATVSRKY
jgi:uncharacterized protein YfiM (DUF2279 family)